jgi:hypothetical protein
MTEMGGIPWRDKETIHSPTPQFGDLEIPNNTFALSKGPHNSEKLLGKSSWELIHSMKTGNDTVGTFCTNFKLQALF